MWIQSSEDILFLKECHFVSWHSPRQKEALAKLCLKSDRKKSPASRCPTNSHSVQILMNVNGRMNMKDRNFLPVFLGNTFSKETYTLNTLPFSKGKSFSTKACTKTRRTAAVCIHVERAIQRLKCFQILRGVIPITLSAVADQTVFVCGILCTLMKPLVSN